MLGFFCWDNIGKAGFQVRQHCEAMAARNSLVWRALPEGLKREFGQMSASAVQNASLSSTAVHPCVCLCAPLASALCFDQLLILCCGSLLLKCLRTKHGLSRNWPPARSWDGFYVHTHICTYTYAHIQIYTSRKTWPHSQRHVKAHRDAQWSKYTESSC